MVRGRELDIKEFDEFFYNKKITMAEASRTIGMGDGALSNCRSRKTMTKYIHKSLEMAYGIGPDDFYVKEEKESVPENADEKDKKLISDTNALLEETKLLLEEIKSLKNEISKLGNIGMQNMEYLKAIKVNTEKPKVGVKNGNSNRTL